MAGWAPLFYILFYFFSIVVLKITGSLKKQTIKFQWKKQVGVKEINMKYSSLGDGCKKETFGEMKIKSSINIT